MAAQTPFVTLITGCSSGIGMSTAVMLANDDRYVVYATMRNLAKKNDLEKASGDALDKTLFILELDVTKEDTITKTVKTIMEKHGRLDILVNNAGYGGAGFIEVIPLDQIRKHFEANVFGLIRVTQEVIPIMKRQRSGRIINISSVIGVTALPFCESYCSTKYAVEGFTESLSMTLRPWGIWVTSVQPGPVKTAFFDNIGPANNQTEFSKIGEADVDAATKEAFGMAMAHHFEIEAGADQTGDDVAVVIKQVLEEERPQLLYQSSDYVRGVVAKKFVDPTGDTYINSVIPHMIPQSLKTE